MQPINITSDNGDSSSIQHVSCTKSGCGIMLTGSEAYHNRVVHQEVVYLRRDGEEAPLMRDTETRCFLCPICSSYENMDPSNVRVSTELSQHCFTNSLNFSHISWTADFCRSLQSQFSLGLIDNSQSGLPASWRSHVPGQWTRGWESTLFCWYSRYVPSQKPLDVLQHVQKFNSVIQLDCAKSIC